MGSSKEESLAGFFLINRCRGGNNRPMTDKKNDREKTLRKYRLLKTVNKVLIGLGILFILYVAYAYIVYFYTLSQVK